MNQRPFFWWGAKSFDNTGLILLGMDEFHWRTIGFRLPFGMLFYRWKFDYECWYRCENMRLWGREEGPTPEQLEELGL